MELCSYLGLNRSKKFQGGVLGSCNKAQSVTCKNFLMNSRPTAKFNNYKQTLFLEPSGVFRKHCVDGT